MPATFVVGATTATFHATISGSQDEAGDLERMTLGLHFDADADWSILFTLVTTKYHIHVPVSGTTIVVDVARGPGAGTLTVPSLITCHALLVDLHRSRWARAGKILGQGTWLITSIP